jgi:hypothetical protein
MQIGDSPFSKKKVNEYIEKGEWTLKPKKMAKGGNIGEELMGGQPNQKKPSGAILLEVRKNGKEIIVTEDGGETKELYVKSNGYSGYTLHYNGNQYEFVETLNSMANGGNIKYGSVVYEVVKDSNGYKIINKYDLGDEEKNFNEYTKEKYKRKPFIDTDNWRLSMILFNFKRFKKENLFDFIPNEKLDKIYDKYSKGGAVDMYPKFDLNKSGNYFATINNKNYEIIYRDDKSQIYDLFQNNKKIKSDRSIRNLMKFPKIYKDGGMIESQIDALYEKSGFINDDFNWKLKLIEMLEDSSIEAYQIYQKLNSKQKEEVLQELFSMNNDMGADGDGEIETSRENLEILLEDAKNGKKYAKGGRVVSLREKKAYNKMVDDYKYFVIVNNKIESGFEYKSDAEDLANDNYPKGKVLSALGVKRLGLDLEDFKNRNKYEITSISKIKK